MPKFSKNAYEMTADVFGRVREEISALHGTNYATRDPAFHALATVECELLDRFVADNTRFNVDQWYRSMEEARVRAKFAAVS